MMFCDMASGVFVMILFGYSYYALNQLIDVAKKYLEIKIDLTGVNDYDKL